MSLGVEVSARGASMVVVLSGTAEAAALDGLNPVLAAALNEGRAVVVDTRTLALVGSAGFDRMLSGLSAWAGQLHLIGPESPGCLGGISGVSVAVHASVEEALVAIEARAKPLDGHPW